LPKKQIFLLKDGMINPRLTLNHTFMRYSTRFTLFSLLFTLILAPLITSAQVSNNDYGGENGHWYRSSDFQEKVDALPSAASAAVVMPVLFGVGVKNISPNFGDPRSGGRSHEGEDIMAIKGTPIISPTAAVVLRTGYGESAGNYVYTANPGGETFVYMHLTTVGEGVVPGLVLAQGSLIGYVGNTGNASGGAAHLHFEIHNSKDNPTNPFPRLTAELSVSEKMTYLNTIMAQTTNSQTLAQFLVTNFKSTFTSALAQGIILPSQINNLLASGVVSLAGAGEDLVSGDTGASVVALQKYLIEASAGSAAQKLKAAGATGTFGPVTKAALVEFQLAKGISPASGLYGPVTRAYVAAHSLDVEPVTTPVVVSSPTVPASTNKVTFTHDLRYGMTNADVRTLQIFLNSKGFTIATTGVGSPGKETTYFGLATQAAVKKFQTAYGIKPVNGNVGPLTRAAIAAL
jgi:peptidoglycan hydrolase-like protein with peptidoglycan-binding domain